MTELEPRGRAASSERKAGLHLALESWNVEHGGAAGRLSVLMPVNLRPTRQTGLRLPAAGGTVRPVTRPGL